MLFYYLDSDTLISINYEISNSFRYMPTFINFLIKKSNINGYETLDKRFT